jgi:hypothetical protein
VVAECKLPEKPDAMMTHKGVGSLAMQQLRSLQGRDVVSTGMYQDNTSNSLYQNSSNFIYSSHSFSIEPSSPVKPAVPTPPAVVDKHLAMLPQALRDKLARNDAVRLTCDHCVSKFYLANA